MEHGFCKAYRKAWQHEVFNDLLEAAIWNYLYQNAFYEDGVRHFNGTTFNLKRGQIVVTPRFLAKGFCTSEKKIRGVIKRLSKCGMVGNQTTNKGTIITICNYNKYQSFEKTKDQSNQDQCEIKMKPKGANNKEYKEIKNNISTSINTSTCERIVEIWNKEMNGVLPLVKGINAKRRTALNRMLKEMKDNQEWKFEQYCKRIKQSDFLTGRSKPWKANFDWAINTTNLYKVIEGNYDNGR